MPVFQLTEQPFFPPAELAEENGLLAIGGDLRPGRLLAAYANGIFPWFGEGDPILWWFTSPRLILLPTELHVPRRLARTIRQRKFQVTVDCAFAEVINACAESRTRQGDDTWILPEMVEAYRELHRLGYGHSVECWLKGELAGGLYGILLDRVFFGESMFSASVDASKVALVHLASVLKKKGVSLIDCQMTTAHLQRFGAREVSGPEFKRLLRQYIGSLQPDGKWSHDET